MNLYSIFDNDSAKYYDTFQKLVHSFEAVHSKELDPACHLNDDCCGWYPQPVADAHDQAAAPKAQAPIYSDSPSFPENPGTTLDLEMEMEDEYSNNPDLNKGACGDTCHEMACQQWYTDLLVTQNHGQSDVVVNEYYEYLKDALQTTLIELNVPATSHFTCCSSLADYPVENGEIHQTVRYKLIENPRAVELMDLLGIV